MVHLCEAYCAKPCTTLGRHFLNNLRPPRRLVVHRCLLLKQLEAASQARRPPLFGEITALFLEELERALLRLVARLCEALQRLLARRMLSPGNNAPLLRLH